MNKLVTERVVSDLTGIALSTLRNARHAGYGMPYHKLMNRAVRYSLEDVENYVKGRRIDPEAAK